jgi:hypothetical protein
VKRSVAVLMGLVLLPLIGFAPNADAAGGGVCSISGTINFLPESGAATKGKWSIEPAVISCQGLFRAYERITGPGAFLGTGTYTALPDGNGACLHQVGSGEVDYTIPTTEADVHITEPHEFVLAGGGAFTTPSLNGSFEVTPPYHGDCMTRPVTRATFVAQGVLLRNNGLEH